MTFIVDTNVILVANRQHPDVSEECISSCSKQLQSIMASGRIALDSNFEIISEYQNKTQPNRGKGPGDVFLKWALQNNANTGRCDLIDLKPHSIRGYESFPEDDRLSKFDPPDRKFVAVAAAHEAHPPILQAADSKWLGWAPALADHGIQVDFLCPCDIQRFHEKKFGK